MKRCTLKAFLCVITAVFSLAFGVCSAGTADIGDSMREFVEADWIRSDTDFDPPGKTPSEAVKVGLSGVTTAQDAAGACDGVKNGRWGFHTASAEQDPWWQVDLQGRYKLGRIVIFNRTDGGTAPRTKNIQILVAQKDADFKKIYQHDGEVFYGVNENKPLVVSLDDVTARIVRLRIPGKCSFALDEVEVYAAGDPQKNIALNKPANQKSVSQHSYPGTLPEGVDSAAPPGTALGGSFTLAHTRQVIERGKALVARLRHDADAKRLDQ
jgi:hypothetical protein